METQEYLSWPGIENLRFRHDAVFFGSDDEFQELAEYASQAIDAIVISQSLRLVVLETWLLVDYSIRQLIMSGLSLSDYDHEDLELRYHLLPRSFRECADVLGRIIAVNRELPPQPRDRRAVLTGGIEFLQYLYNQRRDVWDALQEAQDSYNREQFPELGDGPYMFIPADRRNYRRVSDRWLEAVRQIDEEWLRRADWINSARNRAAHSHDEARIARQLGFNGPNVLQQVKQSCLELIEQLLGIVPFEGD